MKVKVVNFKEVQHNIFFMCCFYYPEKSLSNPKTQFFSLMISSRNFVTLALIFTSMLHFKLIFIYSVKEELRFICLHKDIQLFWHHLFSFFQKIHELPLVSLSKTSCLSMFCLFLDSVLFPWPRHLVCYSFIINFEIS